MVRNRESWDFVLLDFALARIVHLRILSASNFVQLTILDSCGSFGKARFE